MVLFDSERLPTVVTLGMGRDKGSGLRFHEVLLQRSAGLLCFKERQAEMLDRPASLLEDCHIGEGCYVVIVIAHHKLDSDLRGSRPPVWVTPARWLILLQTEG